jgi:hypothetical protein
MKKGKKKGIMAMADKSLFCWQRHNVMFFTQTLFSFSSGFDNIDFTALFFK